jgi:hypothetical protein
VTLADLAAVVAETFVGWVAKVAEEIESDLAVPVSYPVLVVTTVTLEAVPELTPVTVIRPVVLLIVAGLPNEFVTDHVVAVS